MKYDKRWSRHEMELGKLLKRLEDKERYDYVEPEVPVYWNGSYGQLAGRIDILTINHYDDKFDTFTYWEVKTGQDKHCLPRAKQQFKKVYNALRKSPFPVEHYTMRFVYYNPKTKTIRHFRPETF